MGGGMGGMEGMMGGMVGGARCKLDHPGIEKRLLVSQTLYEIS